MGGDEIQVNIEGTTESPIRQINKIHCITLESNFFMNLLIYDQEVFDCLFVTCENQMSNDEQLGRKFYQADTLNLRSATMHESLSALED